MNGGSVVEDREKPIMYTCYTCKKNFTTKECPKCKKKGTTIYNGQIVERSENNPTDINAFFDQKGNKN